MPIYDFTVLTASKYLKAKPGDEYTRNILTEDTLVMKALESQGYRVNRLAWDDRDFNWRKTRFALFRTTWDYFDRFVEFRHWLDLAGRQTTLINCLELIRWNMDKHYLLDLCRRGIRIPPTRFIEPGETASLNQLAQSTGWAEFILKPAVSGGGRHTYRFKLQDADRYQSVFQDLIRNESMLLQEFLTSVPLRGEVALMVIGGRYTHAILKKAKSGDFRVQDDFGGTVHDYRPDHSEILLAEQIVNLCPKPPVYARVDLIWDNQEQPCVSELELIEPELWFRNNPAVADQLAESIVHYVERL
ncbi:MAG: hypothetical protein KBA26_04905 [Candidatus Delongbacteria bacterium]|nr:hypothetical protein [Candidatus Delongbacteria bacterium]